MSTATTKIPLPYRTLFILLDIALPLMGITFNLFAPHNTLATFSPLHDPTSPIPASTLVLLHSDAGFFAALCFLNIFLLAYRPNDILIWKGLATAVMLQDLFTVGGFMREIRLRQNLGVQIWTGQDYGNVVGYGAIALVRLLFVLGVGIGNTRPVVVVSGGKGKTKKEL